MTNPEPLTPEVPLHLQNTLPQRTFDLRTPSDFDWLRDYFAGYHGVRLADAERAARRGFWCYTQGHGDSDRCVEHGDIPRTQSIANHIQSAHGLTYEQYLAQRPEDAPDHIPAYRAARQTPEDQP